MSNEVAGESGGYALAGGQGQAQISKGHRRAFTVAAIAALGGFLFGFDTAVINGAVDAIRDEFDASAWAIGLTVSSALLGSAVGAWYAGRLADSIGRVRTMFIAAILFLISAVGSGFAFSLIELGVWRVIGGFAVGAASVVCPMYIAETAPASLRGRFGSLQQLAIVFGIFLALLSDYILATAAGGAGDDLWFGLEAWRWMFLVATIPAIGYAIGARIIPRSPRYLVSIGRERQAAQVLAQLGEPDPRAKVTEIRETVQTEIKPKLRDLRAPRFGLLPIVWVGVLLSAFQQFVGINVIFYYSSTLWASVGFSEENSLLITVITGLTNIVSTFVAIALVDRVGRRPLLLVGSLGMVVSLGALTLLFGLADRSGDGAPELGSLAGPMALVAANVFVLFFGLSWGPVVWVLLGEIFPNRIRAIALSVAAAVQWIANWLISTTFPVLQDANLAFAYGIYAASAVLSFWFVYKMVPETKGRELEEIGASTSGAELAKPAAAR